MPHLDISPLAGGLLQLDEGLRQAEDYSANELLRDGVIQRFEYSHELALKFIRQVLETVFGETVVRLPYKDLLETASGHGLIRDPQPWIQYRLARNQAPHAYDSVIAANVYEIARPFLVDARELLFRLHDLVHSIADSS